jgi:hypothetical protein
VTARFIGLSLEYAFKCGCLRTKHNTEVCNIRGKTFERCKQCHAEQDRAKHSARKTRPADYLLVPGVVMR